MKAIDKIIKARAGLILDAPFFGSLALRMAIKEDSSCETAYTNGTVIGFNPSFIDTLSLDETKGLICHEVMHIAACHHTRRGNRDNERWNIAGDHAINYLIERSGFTLPSNVLHGIDNSAENIYSTLPEPDENEDGGDDPGGCGEVRDLPGKDGGKPTQAEREQAEQQVKVTVAQAVQQAKASGNIPQGFERFIEDVLEPEVNWKELLARFIQKNAKNDYSWSPPNRRFIHMGLYLPSLNSEELKNVIIAVDTSGSIDVNMLNQFSAEITGVLEAYDTETTVIYCDTSINKVEIFKREDLPLTINAIGGGGTDFRPPFNWIEEQGIAPACMIYLTDMYCSSFPDMHPDYPVLWVRYGGGGYEPPFGDLIDLK